jgi:hypothetical protein
MTDEKPLTISNLISAMKEAGFATKEDVGDIVHEQLTNYHAEMISPEIKRLGESMEAGFKQVNSRLDKGESDIHWLKDEVRGLKEDFALTPSQGESKELKRDIKELKMN